MSEAEILFEKRGKIGLVTLNRPKALNSLTATMCGMMLAQLKQWALDPDVGAVVVVGAGEKAFCAGGDVVKVSADYQAGGSDWKTFFHDEYQMNVAIDEFPKPYVALVDGITMGGGVGISIPGDFWVATEKTLFAMPETGLGLFPDVGGGWFLPRLPGASGMYMALTGARAKAGDLYGLGIASHVIASADVDAVVADLADKADGTPDTVDAVLAAHHSEPEGGPMLADMPQIDTLFAGNSVQDILDNLARDGSDFAQKQLDILGGKSPLSLKVTFSQLTRGAAVSSFRSNMLMEYRVVNNMMAHPDFHEGVRAILVDKDHSPVWSPATLDAVADTVVDAVFAPLDDDIHFD